MTFCDGVTGNPTSVDVQVESLEQPLRAAARALRGGGVGLRGVGKLVVALGGAAVRVQ